MTHTDFGGYGEDEYQLCCQVFDSSDLHANSQKAGNELRIGSLGLELTVLLLFQVLQGRNSVPVPADEFETKKSVVESASAI